MAPDDCSVRLEHNSFRDFLLRGRMKAKLLLLAWNLNLHLTISSLWTYIKHLHFNPGIALSFAIDTSVTDRWSLGYLLYLTESWRESFVSTHLINARTRKMKGFKLSFPFQKYRLLSCLPTQKSWTTFHSSFRAIPSKTNTFELSCTKCLH